MVQCQICSRVGHLSQRCVYRYAHPIEAPLAPVMPRLYGGVVLALPAAVPRMNEHVRYNTNPN